MTGKDRARPQADQALVSDQAAAHLDPSGFDPSRDSCGNCKHWLFEREDWQFNDLRVGECKAVKMRETIEEEAVEGTLFNRWDEQGESLIRAAFVRAKAIAVDGSGYYAALRTFADFGCVLHARRDSDTHPKDGDAKQAPLVSGADPKGIAQGYPQ